MIQWSVSLFHCHTGLSTAIWRGYGTSFSGCVLQRNFRASGRLAHFQLERRLSFERKFQESCIALDFHFATPPLVKIASPKYPKNAQRWANPFAKIRNRKHSCNGLRRVLYLVYDSRPLRKKPCRRFYRAFCVTYVTILTRQDSSKPEEGPAWAPEDNLTPRKAATT